MSSTSLAKLRIGAVQTLSSQGNFPLQC